MTTSTSVSMRSTKAEMYSEIERLRTLCDLQAQQLKSFARPTPRATQPLEPWQLERKAKVDRMRELSMQYKTTARLRDGEIELYSQRDRCWKAVP